MDNHELADCWHMLAFWFYLMAINSVFVIFAQSFLYHQTGLRLFSKISQVNLLSAAPLLFRSSILGNTAFTIDG